MQASLRLIYEVIPSAGVDPEVQIDTDELSPPAFVDLVVRGEQHLQIGPSVTDQAVAVPNSCIVLVFSDEPILMRLSAGETQLRARFFAVAAEDETGRAVTARNLLLSGNGTTTANVRVLYAGDT